MIGPLVRLFVPLLVILLGTTSLGSAATEEDLAVCMKARASSDSSADSLAACARFIATGTGTARERGIAYDVLAYAKFRNREYEQALAAYQKVIDADPTGIGGYLMRARAYRLLARYDEAITTASDGLRLIPDEWQTLFERGRSYVALGNFDAALPDLEMVAKRSPNAAKSPDYLTALGQALNGTGNSLAALEKFDAALKIDAKRSEALYGRCDALKGSAAAQENIDSCLNEADAGICSFTSNASPASRQIACEHILSRPATTGHSLAVAHAWKAAQFKSKKDFDEALNEYGLAIQSDPDFSRAYAARADLKRDRNDIDGALADLDEAIRRDPKSNIGLYAARGNLRILTGDFEGAVADFDIAIPAAGYLHLTNRSRAKILLKNYDGAIDDLTLALERPLETASKANAHMNRCRAFVGKGEIQKALADCNEAISIDPRYGAAFTARGEAYLARGDLDRALADLNLAVSILPNYIKCYLRRGEVYERKKDLENARSDYQIAASRTANFETAENRSLRQSARDHLSAMPLPVVTTPTISAPSTPKPDATAKQGGPSSAPVAPAKQGAVPRSRRVALVVGNGAYRNVPALPNPPKDANAVAKSLESVGFEVVQLGDELTRDAFLEALHRFSIQAAKAEWAVVYYAGHGIEIGGVNYLIPVDAKLRADTDAEREAISLELVVAAVSGAKKMRLIMLDACRDNPFAKTMEQSLGLRLVNKGLSNIEPDAGIMVVYATKHGETAGDGEGGHSPFATAVINDLPRPGIEVRRLFDIIRDDVITATHRVQQPFSYGSLPGNEEFYFVASK